MTTYRKPLHKKVEALNLDVLGFPYKVELVTDLIKRFNCAGCANVWGSEINLDPDVSNLDLLSSLVHEMLELMFRKTETKCDHDIITKMEVFLMMLFIDNTDLMELILETAKKEGESLKNRRTKVSKRLEERRKGKSRK